MRTLLVLVSIAFLWTSCELEEIPIDPYDRGDKTEKQVEMGANYLDQIWYDIGTNTVVSTNDKYAWDLAFDAHDTAHAIYLNGAIAMKAVVLETTDIQADVNPFELFFRPDISTGIPDSVRLKDLAISGKVAVIDRGVDVSGEELGHLKLQVKMADNNESYEVQYLDLENKWLRTLIIQKEAGYNRSYLSFDMVQQVTIEPPKDEYDLVFTQYTYQFYEPFLAYLVTGVLLNPSQTVVAVDKEKDFDGITAEDLASYDFTQYWDAIGYNWKYFDLEASTYLVFPEINYIIKDGEGFYYKLHFTDFYSEDGDRGYPKFEFQRI